MKPINLAIVILAAFLFGVGLALMLSAPVNVTRGVVVVAPCDQPPPQML